MIRVTDLSLNLLDAYKYFAEGIFEKCFGVVTIYHYNEWLWVLV